MLLTLIIITHYHLNRCHHYIMNISIIILTSPPSVDKLASKLKVTDRRYTATRFLLRARLQLRA